MTGIVAAHFTLELSGRMFAAGMLSSLLEFPIPSASDRVAEITQGGSHKGLGLVVIMVKKNFFAHNAIAILGLVWIILNGPLLGYFIYALYFKRVLRLVKFRNGTLKVPQDWASFPF